MLKSYLKRISVIAARGDAREESYYRVLEDLVRDYASSSGKKSIDVTTLPKKTEAGNPDFRVWDGSQHIVGYIEAKKPTETNLDRVEETEQLKRYLHTFPNLVLTNFLEFRLYQHGGLVGAVQIARPAVLNKLKVAPPVEKEAEFFELISQFFAFSFPKAFSAKTLAIDLAKKTRFLKDLIAEELKGEAEKTNEELSGFYEAFQKYLIKGLTKDDFADLYAQTITYGLFAARTRSGDGFSRRQAFENIPHTIGILRDVFRFISIGELPKQMEWLVDDISEVLSVADVNRILHKYFTEGRGSDPIVHFYETFLAEYDPREREQRGVYYTPEPVVSYITRSLNIILKEYFGRPDGFATDSVTVLDPAAGTLTFLADSARCAVEEFAKKYGEGGKARLIREHILKNFYAFELMMAPYAVGHLKMSFLLEELGYRLKDGDRMKLYLTNTLEMEELAETKLPGMSSLAEESHLAGKVKKETPILAVLGNPPYSGISTNRGDWITKLIEDFKYVDGKHFGEKKHWLQDDYVKFIRFAQWKIDQTGEGVLGFITNHSYLDNPTFRGMRQSLMRSFNEIYILDLHGNSLKKEKCPDGGKDENVFDIRQGVAIGFFIKRKRVKTSKVFHAEIWGLREEKNDWLTKNNFQTTKWKALKPSTPYYFFVPRKEAHRSDYEKFRGIAEIFPVNVTGIVTARDHFVIDLDKNILKSRIMQFRNRDLPDVVVKEGLGLKENYMWRVAKARKELMGVKNWEDYFTKILYRPFDIRNIYFHPSVVWRTRRDVMRHMTGENLGLIMPRRVELSGGWQHALLAENIIEHVAVSLKTIDYLFPLYLYPDTEKKDLLSSLPCKKEPNLKPEIVAAIEKAYGKKPSPEEIFYYIYAVFYSNTYRAKYAEFLKTDFPRVPFTKDFKLFQKMSEKGKELAELHLLKSPALDSPTARFQGKGSSNTMEKPVYDEKQKRVYINNEQYFEGIDKEVWEYMVGGYQVLGKWLKDRRKRKLSLEDIRHYCRVATALKKTIEVQKEIDEKVYPGIEAGKLC